MQRANPLNWKFTSLLKLILLVQFLFDISILLDISFIRQTLGFIYLTFIPGTLLIKALKIDNLTFTRYSLFSVGLSITLIMFLGLSINELYLLVGISEPLSTTSLTLIMNLVTLSLCLIGYFRREDEITLPSFKFSPLIFPFVSLPLLSFIGTFLVNNSGNNSLLLLMIALIPLLVTLGAVSKRLLSQNLYPLVLLCIALALVFHTSLITNYIVGWDVNAEYYVFGFTKNNLRWDKTFTISGRYYTELLSANTMLSVTILPVVYSQISKLAGSYVFKILYPFAISLAPLGLYQLWYSKIGRKSLTSLGVFLSTFFIISIQGFYSFIPPKQMVAELFYVLLFVVLFDERIGPWQRKSLFMIFSAALIVSHYSTAYLFMFLIFLTWLVSFLRGHVGKKVPLNFVTLFFVMSFSWYIYTSTSGVFESLMTYGDHIYKNFVDDLFSQEARGSTVMTAVGMTSSPSLLHQIGRLFFYITEFFIVIGMIKLVIKRLIRRDKTMKLDEDYVTLTCLNMSILLMCVTIPNFANLLRMGRFYHLTLLFLAPMGIIGGKTFFSFFPKLKTEFSTLILVLILVLTPILLFETEFVYTVAGDNSAPVSLALNMYTMDPVLVYNQITLEQEVLGARWLNTNTNMAHTLVCGDYISVYHVLTSYGMIPRDHMRVISNFTMEGFFNLGLEAIDNRTHIYLRRLNVVNGILADEEFGGRNITGEISSILDSQNKIYANEDCEIFNGIASP